MKISKLSTLGTTFVWCGALFIVGSAYVVTARSKSTERERFNVHAINRGDHASFPIDTCEAVWTRHHPISPRLIGPGVVDRSSRQ